MIHPHTQAQLAAAHATDRELHCVCFVPRHGVRLITGGYDSIQLWRLKVRPTLTLFCIRHGLIVCLKARDRVSTQIAMVLVES